MQESYFRGELQALGDEEEKEDEENEEEEGISRDLGS
jgi:hypothetical protein